MKVPEETLDAIAEVKFCKLTHRGVVELVKFTPEAIRYALSQVPHFSPHIRDKFRWFCKVCTDYSRANHLPVNAVLYTKCKAAAIKYGHWLPHATQKIDTQFREPICYEEELKKALKSPKLNKKGLRFMMPLLKKLNIHIPPEVLEEDNSSAKAPESLKSKDVPYTEDTDEDTGYDPTLDPFGDKSFS